MEFGDAHGRGFADVGVVVAEGVLKRVADVLGDLVDADATHRAHGEGADQGVGVHGVFDERVHGLHVVRRGWGTVRGGWWDDGGGEGKEGDGLESGRFATLRSRGFCG